jgi:hypothetical protein
LALAAFLFGHTPADYLMPDAIILSESPSLFKCYSAVLLRLRSGVPKDGKLPALSFSRTLVPEAEALGGYRELCGCAESADLPAAYPYVLAGSLQLALIAHRDFPIRALGLLHLRNHIRQHRAISVDERLTISVQVGQTRFRPQGFEFDLLTRVRVSDELVWECTSAFIKRGKFEREDPASPLEETVQKLEGKTSPITGFEIPSDIGRRYARLCGDYNPIHVSSVLAKLFGLKRNIAHGMWVSARLLSAMGPLKPDVAIDLAFKGPAFTGNEAVALGRMIDDVHNFNIFCGKNPRPVILGAVSGSDYVFKAAEAFAEEPKEFREEVA